MLKWLRRIVWTVLVLALLGAPAYYLLVLHSPKPDGRVFDIDVAQIRALADAVPGDKPREIRYEQIAAFEFAQAMLVAGAPWKSAPMPIYAYELVYPETTIMVDSALDRDLAKPKSLVPMYDEQAYARLLTALDRAAQIVITHEHADHIGGIARHPRLAELLPRLRLTAEQLAHPDRMQEAKLPAELFRDYAPLVYDGLFPLAPGVVLVKSPGHTPGSQMVYVQLADGGEVLLLGDVAWQQRQIDAQRERPLLMTTIIEEDRQAVLAQFRALKDLARREPALHQLPGHDAPAVAALTAAGVLRQGFLP